MMPGSMYSDTQIQRVVYLQLAEAMRTDGADIAVAVNDGVVTLTGAVIRYVTKLAAQEAAHRVPGVRAVANDIAVQVPGAGVRTSADIARAVRWALARDARVPLDRIQTTVSDGWVTLEGQVDRWSQRGDAEGVVRRLPGVRGVMNRITVGAPLSMRRRGAGQQMTERRRLFL